MWLNCRHGLMFSTAQTSEERALKYSFRLFVYRCNRRGAQKRSDIAKRTLASRRSRYGSFGARAADPKA